MSKKAYAVKLSESVLKELKFFCLEYGYRQGAFVEKALTEQMMREELKEDIFDLVSLRSQEALAKPFSDYRRSRK